MKNPAISLASRLYFLRKLRGAKQTEIAAAAGMAQGQYSRYETGHTMPGLNQLVKLADVYDCSVDWLLGRKHRGSPVFHYMPPEDRLMYDFCVDMLDQLSRGT